MMNSLSRLRLFMVWMIVGVALLLLCGVTGRLTPHTVNDTPSYVDYDWSSVAAMAREIRSPVYPFVLAVAKSVAQSLTPRLDVAFIVIVIGHVLLHAAAVVALTIELTRHRIPIGLAGAAGLATAVCPAFWDHASTIATDAPSASLGVGIIAAVLRTWRTGHTTIGDCQLGVLTLIAIGMRPAYLFLLPWLVLMCVIPPAMFRRGSLRGRIGWTSRVLAVPALGLVTWCGVRGVAVGDFGLLPFGHQNMAAVTTQLLDADELRALPGRPGMLGGEIADRRIELSRRDRGQLDRQTADRLDLRTVPDATSRADSAMTLENRWDAMTYLVVVPAAGMLDDDPIVQHQLLAELDRAIVTTYPWRYLRWWLLAIRRGVWGGLADIAMHSIYLPVLLMGLAMVWWAAVRDGHGLPGGEWFQDADSPRRILAPLVVSTTYALASIGFVALTSPLIGRFSDAAMVFVPGVLAMVGLAFLFGPTMMGPRSRQSMLPEPLLSEPLLSESPQT